MKLLIWFSLIFAPTFAHGASSPAMTRSEFLGVLAVARKTFTPLATSHNRRLEIMSDWSSDWAQAFTRRWETDQVLVYGGIARIAGGTQDSLALLICHELGHLYAGAPYSDEHSALSAEGQADWWATNFCWPRFAEQLPSSNPDIHNRAIRASLIVTAFYAANRNIPAPTLQTPDLTIVEKTLLTHPEPQCRLDTYVAGLANTSRPLCWWNPEG